MARLFFAACNVSAQALSANVAKTALQVASTSTDRVALMQLSMAFDGILNTAVPVLLQIMRQTSAGSQAGGSTATIQKKDNGISTPIQTTVLDGMTAEPTAGAVLWSTFVHPQGGVIYPPMPEIVMAESSRVGVVLTAPANVDVLVSLEGEE